MLVAASCPSTSAKWNAGVTLLEMLIALTILTLLGAMAAPGFANVVRDKRGEITMARLEQMIMAARHMAISAGQVVTLCRSVDGEQCGGQWSQGVVLFTDANANRRVDGGDRILRYQSFASGQGSIRWRSFGNRQYLQFTALGFTKNQNGNFTYCPFNGELAFARQLIVNRAGRARRSHDTNGDGIVEDSRGRPVRC